MAEELLRAMAQAVGAALGEGTAVYLDEVPQGAGPLRLSADPS